MKTLSILGRRLAVLCIAGFAGLSNAAIVASNWTSVNPAAPNYQLTINHISNRFTYHLTINPWNAEALGVMFDLGAVTVGPVGLISSGNLVSTFATDTTSNNCGAGCNLAGLPLPTLGGGDWELVFRLGSSGFEGYQSFTWSTNDFGLDLSDFKAVGLRAQVMCDGNDLLPQNSPTCEGSDKSFSTTFTTLTTPPTTQVPEPATLALAGLSLLAVGATRRKVG